MAMLTESYILPCHPSLHSLDPLDVCGDDANVTDSMPTHWQIITRLLNSTDTELGRIVRSCLSGDTDINTAAASWSHSIEVLFQDIAYGLHNVGDLDVGFLRLKLTELFTSDPRTAHHQFWSPFRFAALALPDEFPSCSIPYLSADHPSQSFTTLQIHTLLAHLFLGTLQIPKGNDWGRPGFLSWFKSDPPILSTVSGYTTTIINYFIDPNMQVFDEPITFTWSSSSSLSTSPLLNDWSQSSLPAARITPHIDPIASEPSPPSSNPESHHQSIYVLLSAHSQPGPGPSGTHEERLQAQSPSLSIISLIAPLLPSDVAIITSPNTPIHASWQGHNRAAELVRLYDTKTEQRPERGYIVADAMELDACEYDGAGRAWVKRDLEDRVIEREVGKLYAGFEGVMRYLNPLDAAPRRQPRIEAVPWGCQAFGGDFVVKAQCMLMAAGLAGVDEIHLFVTEERSGQMEQIMEISQRGLSVKEVMEVLRRSRDGRDAGGDGGDDDGNGG